MQDWATGAVLGLAAVGLAALGRAIYVGVRRGVLTGQAVRRPPPLFPTHLSAGEVFGTGLFLVPAAFFCYAFVAFAAAQIAVGTGALPEAKRPLTPGEPSNGRQPADAPTPPEKPDPVVLSACDTIGRLVGGVGVTILMARAVCPSGVGGLGLTTVGLTGAIRAGAIGFAALWPVCFGLLLAALQVFAPREHEMIERLGAAGSGWAIAVLIFSAVPAAALSEEIFFRGLVQSWIRDVLIQVSRPPADEPVRPAAEPPVDPPAAKFEPVAPPPEAAAFPGVRWAAVVLTSVLFAGAHAPYWHAMPSLFALSMGMGLLLERTGSLAAPITVHLLFNAFNVLISFGRA